MKRIVDISEITYKEVEEYGIPYFSGVARAIIESRPLSEEFVEELEKIKAEIETYRNCLIPYVNDENDYYKGRVFSYDVVLGLLEKHIEELKGENQ